jgi:hypothetical protein
MTLTSPIVEKKLSSGAELTRRDTRLIFAGDLNCKPPSWPGIASALQPGQDARSMKYAAALSCLGHRNSAVSSSNLLAEPTHLCVSRVFPRLRGVVGAALCSCREWLDVKAAKLLESGSHIRLNSWKLCCGRFCSRPKARTCIPSIISAGSESHQFSEPYDHILMRFPV